MTFSWKAGSWLLLLTGALGTMTISCTNDPETFCASKVVEVCEVLSGCCTGSADFDKEACELQISASCEQQFEVEGVHAGEYIFDSGAADSCLGKIESCDDVTNAADPEKDQIKACGNMLTGHRPAGAACNKSAECEKDGGDFPTCYANEICAKVVLSEDECSFSFETNELHQCVPGLYCSIPDKTVDPSTPPSKQALEFSGTCKSPVSKGGKCFADDEPLPCDDGLYCSVAPGDINASTCESRKGKGEACNGSFECKQGLLCDFDGMMAVCTDGPDTQGAFCFVPPECGNGICDDGYEDEASCPADCSFCGDGVCSTGEEGNCPVDCGNTPVCGDGVCAFNDGEPATCPEDCCGDGFCDPGEDANICPIDC